MLEKIGQLLIIGIEGKDLTEKEADFIVRNDIGGVILFSRNIESPQQVFELNQKIQKLSKKTHSHAPFFIGIDQEGGRVARLKEGFTQWPPLSKLGEIGSTSLGFKYAHSMGEELMSVGINLDFAPCVDVLTNPKNPVIGDRSIHSDPEEVAKIASSLVRGYIKSGVIPCAKHFPGHGNTSVDSHEELPKESTDYKTLQDRELVPFKKVFRSRLDMVMTSHILFENIDKDWPVTLSQKFVQDILRQEYRFRGLIISDDLDMKALANHYDDKEIPVRAFQAGVDLLLYCNDFSKPQMALDAMAKALKDDVITAQRVDDSYQRVLDLKKKTLSSEPLPDWNEEAFQQMVAHHQKLADAVKSGSVPADLIQS
ncbi:MAG TPA: beta-N-acetylhexosaminidase [Bdellovibrionales bacterium]|nr:beta-N-acetylhexosaminidase [Pseudobdellovibrionaceae bacterium]HAG90609.1 beta-N-acetylhexosaminidase [Bdellovibrionales bacterium]|tara:strand:+ start:1422 stop:2528 length:1107 start_codon:yes stop_codon:yes gene_type:complete